MRRTESQYDQIQILEAEKKRLKKLVKRKNKRIKYLENWVASNIDLLIENFIEPKKENEK